MKEKILIVEDNPQNMRLVKMILRAKGYTLLEATDGEQALDMARGERPSLIIMDMRLPKMSGFEATRKLRGNPIFSYTPIIGVTAYGMKGDREKVLESGCDVYLSKPFNTRELPGVVARVLSQRQKGITPSLKGDEVV